MVVLIWPEDLMLKSLGLKSPEMKSKSGRTERNNYIKAYIFYWWLIKNFFFGLLGLVLLMQSWPQNTLFHHWILLLSLDQHMTNIHHLAGIKYPITGPISCLLINFTFILSIKNGSSTAWIPQNLTKMLCQQVKFFRSFFWRS